jgi:hypothetical protein
LITTIDARSDLNRHEYEALLRHDFASFARRCFRELNPQTAFALGWHVEIVAAKLAALHAGKIRRLVVMNRPGFSGGNLA